MRYNKPEQLLPGFALCLAVAAAASALARLELLVLGRDWLEPLVLAILLGTAVRSHWAPGRNWLPGISFSAKTLLEIAVALLGSFVGAQTIMGMGLGLFSGIAAVVAIALTATYAIGRFFGLPPRMATLVACGNSICGNSAIAAVAPVIGADGEDISASIAFTAVLGVAVVLGLPLVATLLNLSGLQSGVLAGLTVYAVPQVLAATAPLGAVAMHLGTLVKLVRVLMLGPVVLGLSLLTRGRRDGMDEALPHLTAGDRPAVRQLPLHRLMPWYILGFLALAGLRSASLIPPAALPAIGDATNLLTLVSMAALGLGTDLRTVLRAGGRVIATVTLSLLVLSGLSFGLIRVLGVA
jgi:uncharacterized integral membrane protein (TIGR00698 family)